MIPFDEDKRMTDDQKLEEFKALAAPIMKFLSENYHPYVTAVIDLDGAKMVETIAFTPQKKSVHCDK